MRKSSFILLLLILIFFGQNVFPESDIEFTEEERLWLKKKHIVRARVSSWPPLMFKTNPCTGISVDYMQYVADRAGFKVRFVNDTLGWSKSLNDIMEDRKQADVILSITYSPERSEKMNFTDNYLFFPWVIITRLKSDFVSSIDDLNGKVVAVEESYVIKEILIKKYPGINLYVVDSSLEALLAVATNKAEAYIGNLANSMYYIREEGLHNLKVAAPVDVGDHDQAMGVRKDWPELASIISKVINQIPPEKHTEIKNRYLSFRYEYGIQFRDVLQWLLLIVLISIIVIALFYTWNFILQKEVNKRKTAEQELKELNDNLEIIIDDKTRKLVNEKDKFKALLSGLSHVNISVNIVNRDFEILNQSQLLTDHFGDVRGEKCYFAYFGYDKPCSFCPISNAITYNRIESVEVKRGDGRWYQILAGPLPDPDGTINNVIKVTIDVTVEKESKIQLEETMKKLEHSYEELKNKQEQLVQAEKMASLGQLASGIAHEINQPLMGILLGVEKILFDAIAEKNDFKYLKNKAETIIGYVHRIKKTIEHVRIFSRRQKDLNFSPTSINESIENALLLIGKQLDNHKISLGLNLADGLPKVMGNLFKIEQVVLNLLSNAKDALETRAESSQEEYNKEYNKEITITTSHICNEIYISIVDNGIGMDEEEVKHIFDPFYTTKPSTKGTGLGLSITYGLMKEMNGTLEVLSEKNKGSEFKLRFPIIE